MGLEPEEADCEVSPSFCSLALFVAMLANLVRVRDRVRVRDKVRVRVSGKGKCQG